MTWPALQSSYLTYRRSRVIPRTLRLDTRRLEALALFCTELGREPAQVRHEDLLAYRRVLGASFTPGTVMRILVALRLFFRWACRRGHVLLDPSRDLGPLSRPRQLGRVLTVDQVERLLSAADRGTRKGLRNLAILETFYGTGLRLGECRRLDLADLDLNERVLIVRHGKGGRSRCLPVGGHLAGVLGRYLDQVRPAYPAREQALFLNYRGHRMSSTAFFQTVARAGRRAGLAPLSPHRLRHAYATHLLEGGADLRHIQALLGHRSQKTTELYTRIRPVELFRMHRRCHPRARRSPDRSALPAHPVGYRRRSRR